MAQSLRASFLLCAVACGAAASRTVLHERHGFPAEWTLGSRATPGAPVRFRVALKQRNLDALSARFTQVSEPGHTQYRQFMSLSEIQRWVSPSQEDVETLLSWLAQHGITEDNVGLQGDSVILSATASQTEKLLGAELYNFQHEHTKEAVVKVVGPYSVPTSMVGIVDFVCGITEFGKRSLSRRSRSFGALDPTKPVTVPSTIRSLYSLPKDGKVSHPKSTQAVVEFPFGQASTGVLFSDLSKFEEQMGLPAANITSTSGNFVQTAGDPESTLDLQYILAVAQAKTEFTVIDGFMYEYAAKLFNRTDAALVQSISYGGPENQMCHIPSKFPTNCTLIGIDLETYFSRVNVEFQKIGLRGISILACSQDEGAPGLGNLVCALDNSSYPLFPVFPATSPFVTAVGATSLVEPTTGGDTDSPFCRNHSCASGGTEVPAMAGSSSQFTSGGGFSNYSANKAPSYQLEAIATWMKSGALKPAGKPFFKPENRGYPDVSAIGDSYIIFEDGQERVIGGTSASTPVIAGMIALLNDKMLSAGKPPMGFLNPLLYKMAKADESAFHDVTVGNNTCPCVARPSVGKPYAVCCKYGYGAAKGWDPVVGLGTPNFPAWLSYIEAASEAL